MKVLSVFGTRPEAIKMAPVVKELRRHKERIESLVCVTAQHREMLDQVLALFGIDPEYDLNVMQENQSLAQVAANVLLRLDEVLEKEQPDWVLTQGDTTTAMIATLAGFYREVRVGHIEAGLRTWNKRHPFPEEINRKIADAVCDLHFAPTETARPPRLRDGRVAGAKLAEIAPCRRGNNPPIRILADSSTCGDGFSSGRTGRLNFAHIVVRGVTVDLWTVSVEPGPDPSGAGVRSSD